MVGIWVGETGEVVDVAIVGWQFSAATLRGVPVSVRLTFQRLFRRWVRASISERHGIYQVLVDR